MKNAKRLAALFLTAAVLLTAGCSRKTVTSQNSVWFIAKSTNTEFWKSAFAGANAAKSEYNVDLTICGPETEEDYEEQNRLIDEAVAAGADAIVYSAISYTKNAEAITRAAKQGLKIAVIDSDVDSDGVGVRIGTDNVEAGRMAGRAALQTDWDSLTVGIVNFDLGSRNGQERESGFREALAGDPRVKDIYTINVNADATTAQVRTVQLLVEHPEINVIVGFNEPIAVGAAMAVHSLGLTGRVRMVGFDTNVKCIDLLQSGAVSALIVQNRGCVQSARRADLPHGGAARHGDAHRDEGDDVHHRESEGTVLIRLTYAQFAQIRRIVFDIQNKECEVFTLPA